MSTPDVFLPLLYEVKLYSYVPLAKNDLGNTQESWADPVTVDVYGWGSPQMTQAPKEVLVGTSRWVVQLELMVPPGFSCKDGDKIHLEPFADDDWFRVVGPIEDYEHNPLGWNPGSVVNLVAVKGVK